MSLLRIRSNVIYQHVETSVIDCIYNFYVKWHEISKRASAIKRSRFPNAYTKDYAFEYEDNFL